MILCNEETDLQTQLITTESKQDDDLLGAVHGLQNLDSPPQRSHLHSHNRFFNLSFPLDNSKNNVSSKVHNKIDQF